MAKIRTYQDRRLRSRAGGTIVVQKHFDDEPATADTWDANALLIAAETGLNIEDVHIELFRFAPHVYGRVF